MLIKHYKIEQASLSTAHDTLSSTSNVGLIVCEDTRKLYFQDGDFTKKPLNIGTSDFWNFISDSDTSSSTALLVGRKYIRTGAHKTFALPTAEYAQSTGDIIEFFNDNESVFEIKQGSTVKAEVTTAGNKGHYFKFYWDGTNWKELKSRNDSNVATLISDVSTNTNNIDKITGNINKHWDYTTSGNIYPSALPSASVSGDYGIVTVATTVSNSANPVAASGVLNYASAAVGNYISGVTVNNTSVVSDKVAAITVPTNSDISGVASSVASSVASAVVKDMSGTVINGLATTGDIKISGITVNGGSEITPTNKVVNVTVPTGLSSWNSQTNKDYISGLGFITDDQFLSAASYVAAWKNGNTYVEWDEGANKPTGITDDSITSRNQLPRFLKLVFVNQTGDNTVASSTTNYINVNELFNLYTGSNGIKIDENNVVSITATIPTVDATVGNTSNAVAASGVYSYASAAVNNYISGVTVNGVNAVSNKVAAVTIPVTGVTLNGTNVVSDKVATLTNVVTVASPTTNQFVYKTSTGYATSALTIPTNDNISGAASAVVKDMSGTIINGLASTGDIKISGITVNGAAQTPTNKVVQVTVPVTGVTVNGNSVVSDKVAAITVPTGSDLSGAASAVVKDMSGTIRSGLATTGQIPTDYISGITVNGGNEISPTNKVVDVTVPTNSTISSAASGVASAVVKDMSGTVINGLATSANVSAAVNNYVSAVTINGADKTVSSHKVDLGTGICQITGSDAGFVKRATGGTYSTASIASSDLPSATTAGAYGITTINGNSTAASISGSVNPMAASAVYNYVTGALAGLDVESKTSSKLSAVTFNGNTHTGTNCVAALGIMSTSINGTTYAANTSNLINLGTGYVNIASPTANQVVVYNGSTYQTSAITTMESLSATATPSNGKLTVDGGAIPVMIKSVNGNLYPIEKGSLRTVSNNYEIDLTPYLTYENDPSLTAQQWTVYYGGGVSIDNSIQNSLASSLIAAGTSTASIQAIDGEVHRMTVNGTGELALTIPEYNASSASGGLAPGHGLHIRINNAGGRTITFGGNTIASASGVFSFSVYNFGFGVEMIGSVVEIPQPQS